MKEKTSHPILVTIVIILSVAFCTAVFTVIAQNFRSPISDAPADEPVSATPGDTKPYNFDYSWTDQTYIAHALGGIMGDTRTNTYEAFLLNYQLGHRIFEVDFTLTDNGDTILLHDTDRWKTNLNSNGTPLTTDNFLSYLYNGQYHTLDYRNLINLMITYPDIYIVTDSKYTDQANTKTEFNQIINYAKSQDASVLDRFIVQIYHPEMLDWVMELYPWKSVIYTLYQDTDWTPENVIKFARASGVKVVAYYDSLLLEQPTTVQLWNDAGLTVAAYTTNNLNTVRTFREEYGINNFYTDFLLPEASL